MIARASAFSVFRGSVGGLYPRRLLCGGNFPLFFLAKVSSSDRSLCSARRLLLVGSYLILHAPGIGSVPRRK